VVSGFFSNAVSAVVERLWSLSLKSTTKIGDYWNLSAVLFLLRSRFVFSCDVFAPGVAAASEGKSMEMVFDSSMLGIEPYSREVTQNGELLVMDSMNSNIYRMALPLSRCACALAGLLLPSPPIE
jgi:hypothetical protein